MKTKKYNNQKKKEAEDALKADLVKMKKVIENINDTCGIFRATMIKINEKFKCYQFQMIEQDLESIMLHIEDVEKNGPRAAQEEIPLEDSEVSEEELMKDQMEAQGLTLVTEDNPQDFA